MIEADKQKIENEKKNVEIANWYKRMSQTDDGKKIMKDLAVFCGAKRIASDREWNPYRTAFHDGMRNVFLYIEQKIERKEVGETK